MTREIKSAAVAGPVRRMFCEEILLQMIGWCSDDNTNRKIKKAHFGL
jgi:hypothetical protein